MFFLISKKRGLVHQSSANPTPTGASSLVTTDFSDHNMKRPGRADNVEKTKNEGHPKEVAKTPDMGPTQTRPTAAKAERRAYCVAVNF
jgi:hypothetical protein